MPRLVVTVLLLSAQDTSWGHIKELFVDNDVDYFLDGLSMNKNASVYKGADDMHVLKESCLALYKSANQAIFISVANRLEFTRLEFIPKNI